MKTKRLTIIFILISIFYAPTTAQTSPAGVGKPQTDSKGKVYENYLYNFSLEIPKGWVEISSDDSKEFAKLGKEILKPNEKGKKQIEDSIESTQILLSIAKYAPGTPENASLICGVEANRTPQATIAQTALVTQQFFEKNVGYTITSPARQTTLGGRVFYSIKLKKTIETGVTLYQTLYLRKTGNKILEFALTYMKPEDEKIMENSLRTLKFTK